MDAFDAEVAEIRRRGVEPKQFSGGKSKATPDQWAAHLSYVKAYYSACPKRRESAKRSMRKSQLWVQYKLSESQYDAMLAGQSGVCAVCQEECVSGNRLAVDHDHDSGFVRGLLCSQCNHSAGKMKDSPQLLRKLADYIEAGGTQAFCLKTFYQRATETTNARN